MRVWEQSLLPKLWARSPPLYQAADCPALHGVARWKARPRLQLGWVVQLQARLSRRPQLSESIAALPRCRPTPCVAQAAAGMRPG